MEINYIKITGGCYEKQNFIHLRINNGRLSKSLIVIKKRRKKMKSTVCIIVGLHLFMLAGCATQYGYINDQYSTPESKAAAIDRKSCDRSIGGTRAFADCTPLGDSGYLECKETAATDARYQRALNECMRRKGWTVVEL